MDARRADLLADLLAGRIEFHGADTLDAYTDDTDAEADATEARDCGDHGAARAATDRSGRAEDLRTDTDSSGAGRAPEWDSTKRDSAGSTDACADDARADGESERFDHFVRHGDVLRGVDETFD